MMAYEGSESARDNFGKFIYQFQPETKTLIRKLEMTSNKLYRKKNLYLMKRVCVRSCVLEARTHKYRLKEIKIFAAVLKRLFLKTLLLLGVQSSSTYPTCDFSIDETMQMTYTHTRVYFSA